MHPYRTPPPPKLPPPDDRRGDDRLLAAVIAAIGAIPVATAVITGEAFGAEATVGLLLVVLGVIGLIRAE